MLKKCDIKIHLLENVQEIYFWKSFVFFSILVIELLQFYEPFSLRGWAAIRGWFAQKNVLDHNL